MGAAGTNDEIINALHEGFVLFDEAATILQVNPAICKMIGYAQEELLNPVDKSFWLIPQLKQLITRDVPASPTVTEAELTFQRKTGEFFPVHVTLSRLSHQSGKPCYFGLVREVHLQKEKQIDLQQQLFYVLKAQKTFKVGYWLYDISADHYTFSEQVYHLYGLDPHSFDHRLESLFKLIHPDDREYVQVQRARAVESKQPLELDHRLLLPDGTIKWVHIYSEASYSADGHPLTVLGVSQDITHRKLIESELAVANAVLEEKVSISDEQLATRNSQFQLAKEVTGIGTSRINLITGEIEWSEELFQIYGLSEKIPPSLTDRRRFYDPEDWEKLNTLYFQPYASASSYETEVKVHRDDGTTRNVFIKGQPQFDTYGKQTGLINVYLDITRLRQAEQYIEYFFELSSDLLCIANFDGNFVRVNAAWKPILGYEVNELNGQPFAPTVYPDDLPLTFGKVEQLQQSGHSLQYENRMLHRDGSFRIIEWQASSKDNLIFGVGRDITARKDAEKKLAELSDRLQLALHAGRVGIWDRYIDSFEVRYDETMKQLYGLSREPSITYEDFWKAVHRDDVTPLNDALEQALAGTKEFDTEFRVIWPNQSVHYLRSFAYVRRDEQGKAIQLIGVCWDITDSREDRIQLERSKKELEAFSYSVSHDLRGPLRGIQGWSQALQEDYGNRLDAQAHEFLGRVQSEALRMAELIDDLLRLSRIMQSELVTSTIDLSELAVLIAKREQALHPERTLEFVIEEGLQAFGDRKLLEILITNLFTNAVKFTSREAHARIEFGKTKGSTITKNAFFVRDNGVGFDSSKSKNLFGAFQRLHRQSEFPGNGIGLATVSRIVGLHRGEVWAESSVGQGAAFFFTLNS